MMCERCLSCRFFESTDEGAFVAIGEDICSCRVCGEGGEDCPDYEGIDI